MPRSGSATCRQPGRMSYLQAVLAEFGGVAQTSELRSRGIGPGVLYSASRSGQIVRVRKGWYADPFLGPDVLGAARVGGALACVSAARRLGVWTPGTDDCLHVAVPAHAVRLRTATDRRSRLAEHPDGTVVHWLPRVPRATQSVAEAIQCAAGCVGGEAAFVMLESAWNLTLIDEHLVQAMRARSPRWFRPWIDKAGSRSESGSESIVRLILLHLGLRFRQQVEIDGVGRVDFVVGESLVIEADSLQHHSDPTRDRRRDAVLSARGYRVLRFMYSQLFFDRDLVVNAILGALVRGDIVGAGSL